MITAVLPSALVRLSRTAAVRRALMVVGFLGGLLALAFLFGGSAHAAESDGGVPAAGHVLGGESDASGGLADTAETVARETEQAGGEAIADQGGQALDKAVRQTLEPVVRHTEPLTRPVTGIVEDTTEIPVDLPSHDNSDATPRPDDDRNEHAAHRGAHGPSTASGPDAGPRSPAPEPNASCDPRPHTASQDHRGDSTHDRLPAHRPASPSGHASCNAGDGSAPRGGDTNAIAASRRARFGLIAGGVRAASAAPTRERASEILEFPG